MKLLIILITLLTNASGSVYAGSYEDDRFMRELEAAFAEPTEAQKAREKEDKAQRKQASLKRKKDTQKIFSEVSRKSRQNGKNNIFDSNSESWSRLDYNKSLSIVSKDEWMRTAKPLLKLRLKKGLTHAEMLATDNRKYDAEYVRQLDKYEASKARVERITSVQDKIFTAAGFNDYVTKRMAENSAKIKRVTKLISNFRATSESSHKRIRVESAFSNTVDYIRGDSYVKDLIEAWVNYSNMLLNDMINPKARVQHHWRGYPEDIELSLRFLEREIKDFNNEDTPHGTVHLSPRYEEAVYKIRDEMNVFLAALKKTAGKDAKEHDDAQLKAFMDRKL